MATATDEVNQAQGNVSQTPADLNRQTPTETQTFTKKQVDDAIAKAKSDATADYKRLEASFKTSQSVGEAALSRLKAIEEQQYRQQEEAFRDDPDKLSALQMRRDADKRHADVEDKLRVVNAKEAEIQTREQRYLTTDASILATQYNVQAEVLLRFGGGTKESMEDLAKSYGLKNAPAQSYVRQTEPPDDGRTKGRGTGRKPSYEEVKAASPAEFAAKTKSGEWVI